jgi:hypothetical protein
MIVKYLKTDATINAACNIYETTKDITGQMKCSVS